MPETEVKKPGERTGMYQRQVRAIIISAVLLCLLIVGLVVALYFVNQNYYEENGVRYSIEKKNGVYVLCDENGHTCPMTDDGFYKTAIGTLLDVDESTGKYAVYAVVDTEDNEALGNVVTGRILIFPHTEKAAMQAIEIHNTHGGYSFYRNESDAFVLVGSPDTACDPELFSTLVVSIGYPLAMMKLDDAIIDENGGFSEYGLTDSENYWILTTTNDEVYKIIVGDAIPSDGGYYVQYVKCSDVELDERGFVKSMKESPRSRVYILSSDLRKAMLQPVETLVTERIVYPMTMTTYSDVANFLVMKGTNVTVGFTYIDLDKRVFNEQSSIPYISCIKAHEGYTLSSSQINTALQALYSTTFFGCKKLAPSDEDLLHYGIYKNPVDAYLDTDEKNYYLKKDETTGLYVLYDEDGNPCAVNADGNAITKAGTVVRYNKETGEHDDYASGDDKTGWYISYDTPYTIYFEYDVKNEATGVENTLKQYVFFSEGVYSTEQGMQVLYAYSPIYNMVVEIAAFDFTFLDWEFFDWIDTSFFSIPISYVETIEVEFPNSEGSLTNNRFHLENTASQQGQATRVEEKTFTDKRGTVYYLRTLDGKWRLTRKTGLAYEISDSNYLRVMGSKSDSLKLYISYFGKPAETTSGAAVDSGWFYGDMYLSSYGDLIVVNPNSKEANGEWYVVSFVAGSADIVVTNEGNALDVKNFRQFYQTLLYASIEDSANLTPEEEEALVANRQKFQLRVRVKSSEQNLVFEFYYLTSRKSYIRISGDGGETFMGGMYVLTSRVNKIITDSGKAITGEPIIATDKN